MIDRASGHVDPDEDLQLEEDEDQDEQEAEIEPEEDEQEVIQVGQSQQKSQQRPQLEWLVVSQWLQEQEAKLQQVNQLQQEQGKH